MLKKITTAWLIFALSNAIYAEVDIEVSADPSFPVQNLVQDPGFEDGIGKDNFWAGCNYYKGKGEIKTVEDYTFSGKKSLCFMGFSKDAKGQVASREFAIRADMPYALDFRVRSYRELPEGGIVGLRYYLDGPDKKSGSFDAQIASLVKVPEQWVLFSKPSDEVKAETLMLLWLPSAKDEKRNNQAIRNNIIIFPKEKSGGQEEIRARLWISASGLGVIWYDDISLKPLKSTLKYTVKGKDVSEIKVLNKKKEILKAENLSGNWNGEYSGALVVPADCTYRIEVKTKTGETNYVDYPGKKTN